MFYFRNNGTIYTLKNKIQLIDIWLSDCVSSDVIADGSNVIDKSFVIGWPMVNYIAEFNNSHEKRSWFERLQKYVDASLRFYQK